MGQEARLEHKLRRQRPTVCCVSRAWHLEELLLPRSPHAPPCPRFPPPRPCVNFVCRRVFPTPNSRLTSLPAPAGLDFAFRTCFLKYSGVSVSYRSVSSPPPHRPGLCVPHVLPHQVLQEPGGGWVGQEGVGAGGGGGGWGWWYLPWVGNRVPYTLRAWRRVGGAGFGGGGRAGLGLWVRRGAGAGAGADCCCGWGRDPGGDWDSLYLSETRKAGVGRRSPLPHVKVLQQAFQPAQPPSVASSRGPLILTCNFRSSTQAPPLAS